MFLIKEIHYIRDYDCFVKTILISENCIQCCDKTDYGCFDAIHHIGFRSTRKGENERFNATEDNTFYNTDYYNSEYESL